MKDWLKFYFGGFFSGKRLKEAPSRSFWNTVLGLLLSFILVWAGLSVGYIASFGKHYSEATELHRFLGESLGADNAFGVYLTVSDGKLRAEFDDGKACINTFDNAGSTYRLIVDTRPKDTTFDDFSVLCKDENGDSISYDAYLALHTAQRENCSCSIVYSGEVLDVAAHLAEYEAYLEQVSDVSSANHDKDVAEAYGELKSNKNDTDRDEYASRVYELYFTAKYPTLSGKDIYGKAPTLRTYYMGLEEKAPDRKYVLLFDDIAMCAFEASGKVNVDFAGYMDQLDDGTVTAHGMTAQQAAESLDGFFKALFASGSGLASFVCLFSLTQTIPFCLLTVLILSILLFVVCRIGRAEECSGFFGAMKAVGATLTVSAAATATNAFLLSFVMSRGAVFKTVIILFPVIVAVRSIVFAIDVTRKKSTDHNDPEADAEHAEE